MTTRIRNRIHQSFVGTGTATRLSDGHVSQGSSTSFDFMESCTDVNDDFGADHPFTLTRREIRRFPTPITGTAYGVGIPVVEFQNFHHSQVTFLDSAAVTLPAAPSAGVVMAKVLSQTNPSRPVVDLPIFFKELRELPQLVQLAGKSILRRGSGAYLSYEFGWKPLIGDLTKLLNFSDHFSKREREMRSIFEGGGVKRRRDFADDTGTSNATRVAYSTGATIRVQKQWLRRRRIWGTTRWIPDETRLPPRSSNDYRRLARKAVLGLSIEPATLWEAMPWSWMIDWFGSMGDYLNAHRNSVPARHIAGCVMTLNELYETCSRPSGIDAHTSTCPGGEHFYYTVSKSRVVNVQPTIEAYFPMLDRRQLSILGALSVTRNRNIR